VLELAKKRGEMKAIDRFSKLLHHNAQEILQRAFGNFVRCLRVARRPEESVVPPKEAGQRDESLFQARDTSGIFIR